MLLCMCRVVLQRRTEREKVVQDSSKPLCSVIIPVFNVEKWMPESMDSLVSQASEDLEVIIVDDGSTDGSKELCDRYQKVLPRCQVIHQDNNGVASARNTGLRRTTGEYILWMDPDDKLSDQWFSIIKRKLIDYKPDILLFDYQTLYGKKVVKKVYHRPEGLIKKEVFISDIVINVFQTGSLWNKAIKKELLKDIWFDESMDCMEDMNLLFRIAPLAEKILYSPHILYTYRIRDDGLVRKPDLKTAYRCYREAMNYKSYAISMGYGSFIQGVIPHAKGFCCKFYSLGSPSGFIKEYEECRAFLVNNRKAIISAEALGWKEKIKCLLIPNRLVGGIYSKTHKGRIFVK